MKLSEASEPKWLRFDSTGPSATGKTLTWSVRATQDNGYLGRVAWFGRWRRYGFWPDEGTVFEQQCLRDIAAFCEHATIAQRKAKVAP